MRKIHHKILIFTLVLVIIGGSYSYFSHILVSEASVSSPLTSSLDNNSILPSVGKITSDIAFISTLSSLTHITIDTSLFMDKSFTNLKDNTVFLVDGKTGRENPFAPVNDNVTSSTSSNIVIITNDPMEVKSTSAILSGTINNNTKATNAFFEYGLDSKLGNKTSPATVSSIGGFVTNITKLKANTDYFYKACVQIARSISCGDINSFTTTK